MTKLFLFLCLLFLSVAAMSQDLIILHNQDTIRCSIIQITSDNITYHAEGKTENQSISVLPVYKTMKASGDYRFISPKINIVDEDDWRKVLVLDSVAQVEGMYKIEILQSHSTIGIKWNIGTDERMKRKAIEELQRQAAQLQAQAIVLTFTDSFYTYNGTEANVICVAYAYKPSTDSAIKNRNKMNKYQNR
ncbi:MAG: hypothetical protein JWO58_1232 [Chitinophagaceae bacterium]|nr:hypothetical protein [Chitinophagaceae bacterium]